ncbi:response regulator [Burkholderia glumae]|uniref:Response regulator n=1 Tax=Burkholderia glumae TaxID=337 RepID=A0AAQ0BR66_BURGL|nr:response regulator [Burkholderia glumae]ACR30804.1 response regulator receiver domain-containing protein [Burkholderia glumae BGR1]AJY62705.1 response regulator [Burkholderia glumae LMG 2196 = ATCC 33617]KHJ63809.1 response regulator receiver protein [Burkholderia glumae]MCM2483888.1 response regulator [Burkholderia glumae]MCM2494234.1 response regulator [Burkholderia glumae]
MKTILLVDDEFDVLVVWRLLLEQAGYRVLTAPSGAAALEAIRARPPDLVVTDFMMPEMSGADVCAALAAEPAWRGIPIILCSSRDAIPLQPNPLIAYARKPLAFDRLREMIGKLLEGSAP